MFRMHLCLHTDVYTCTESAEVGAQYEDVKGVASKEDKRWEAWSLVSDSSAVGYTL